MRPFEEAEVALVAEPAVPRSTALSALIFASLVLFMFVVLRNSGLGIAMCSAAVLGVFRLALYF